MLETVRLAGDALPLFPPPPQYPKPTIQENDENAGFSPLTRIAHLHTTLFYTAKGFSNASVEGFHKI